MKHMPAAQAKNQFGRLLDTAQREPVTIEKKGREIAVIMSVEDFRHYVMIEDKLWAIMAKKAGKEGFLSEDESQELLDKLGENED